MADAALPSKVLIVDDDESFNQSIENALAKHGIKVFKAPKLETAMYMFNQNMFDVAIVELDFGELPGLALIQKWRSHEKLDRRLTGFIAVATKGRTAQEEGLIRELGDVEVVTKPINLASFISIIAKAHLAKGKAMHLADLKSKVMDTFAKTKDLEKCVSYVLPKVHEFGPAGQDILMALYESSNRWPEALTLVDKLLDGRPNDISLINNKARILLKLGKAEEATKVMEKADALAPMNIMRLEQMAEMYLKMKSPDKGMAKLKQLVDLNPENPDYKFTAMQKLFDHGFDDHAQQFGRSLVSPMDIVRHYNNKGVALSKSGEPAKALSEYKRAIEFFPKFKENYRILYNIALANIGKKDPVSLKAAEEALNKCLSLNPEFEKAKTALAAITKKPPVSKAS